MYVLVLICAYGWLIVISTVHKIVLLIWVRWSIIVDDFPTIAFTFLCEAVLHLLLDLSNLCIEDAFLFLFGMPGWYGSIGHLWLMFILLDHVILVMHVHVGVDAPNGFWIGTNWLFVIHLNAIIIYENPCTHIRKSIRYIKFNLKQILIITNVAQNFFKTAPLQTWWVLSNLTYMIV